MKWEQWGRVVLALPGLVLGSVVMSAWLALSGLVWGLVVPWLEHDWQAGTEHNE